MNFFATPFPPPTTSPTEPLVLSRGLKFVDTPKQPLLTICKRPRRIFSIFRPKPRSFDWKGEYLGGVLHYYYQARKKSLSESSC